jgi:hypothetical protein
MYPGTSAKYTFETHARALGYRTIGSKVCHAMQTKFRLQRVLSNFEEGATSPEAGNQLNRSQIRGDRVL